MSVDQKVQERVISLVSDILSANSIVVDVRPGSRLAGSPYPPPPQAKHRIFSPGAHTS